MLYFRTGEHADFGEKNTHKSFISQDGTFQFSVFRSDFIFTNVLLVVIESKYSYWL